MVSFFRSGLCVLHSRALLDMGEHAVTFVDGIFKRLNLGAHERISSASAYLRTKVDVRNA